MTAKAGIIDGKVAYAMTDKNGGLTALDNDATTTLLGWNLTSNGKADADYWQVVAGVDILSNLNLSANYVTVDYTSAIDRDANGDITSKTSVDEQEIYAQLTYKMSKNLSTYIRYGVYAQNTADHVVGRTNANDTLDANLNTDSRNDSIDDTRGRIQVAYTF